MLLGLGAAAPVSCHDAITTKLTWTNEISRLIYRHCVTCHRDGGTAMSLMTYKEVRPWAKAIRNEVLARRMPPFDAVKGIADYRDDLSLSEPEMELFVAWVEGGSPEGTSALPLTPAPQKSPLAACIGSPVRLAEKTVIRRSMSLCGIKPEGALEVAALLPDQTVQRLLWVREFRPAWNRTYVFRDPVELPAGSQLRVYSSTRTAAWLFLNQPPAQ